VVPDHEYLHLDEDELVARFRRVLPRFNPAFEAEWIRKWWVFRTPYAQPVPFVNQSQRLPELRTPISGLYFASMSQVYPWDRGTNYAVAMGREVAALVLQDLADRAQAGGNVGKA
jgi:glycine/D-amino acid oxidase-like deaminating enzyme